MISSRPNSYGKIKLETSLISCYKSSDLPNLYIQSCYSGTTRNVRLSSVPDLRKTRSKIRGYLIHFGVIVYPDLSLISRGGASIRLVITSVLNYFEISSISSDFYRSLNEKIHCDISLIKLIVHSFILQKEGKENGLEY